VVPVAPVVLVAPAVLVVLLVASNRG
jgi:hypothetical protein